MEITLSFPTDNLAALQDILQLLATKYGLATDETADGAVAKMKMNEESVIINLFNTESTEQ